MATTNSPTAITVRATTNGCKAPHLCLPPDASSGPNPATSMSCPRAHEFRLRVEFDPGKPITQYRETSRRTTKIRRQLASHRHGIAVGEDQPCHGLFSGQPCRLPATAAAARTAGRESSSSPGRYRWAHSSRGRCRQVPGSLLSGDALASSPATCARTGSRVNSVPASGPSVARPVNCCQQDPV